MDDVIVMNSVTVNFSIVSVSNDIDNKMHMTQCLCSVCGVVCVCVCVYVCACLCTLVCTLMRVKGGKKSVVHACVCVCVCTYVHTCARERKRKTFCETLGLILYCCSSNSELLTILPVMFCFLLIHTKDALNKPIDKYSELDFCVSLFVCVCVCVFNAQKHARYRFLDHTWLAHHMQGGHELTERVLTETGGKWDFWLLWVAFESCKDECLCVCFFVGLFGLADLCAFMI